MMTRQCLKTHFFFIILILWIPFPSSLYSQTTSSDNSEQGHTLLPGGEPVDLSYKGYNLFADKVYRKRISSTNDLSVLQDDINRQQVLDDLKRVTSKFISDNSRLLEFPHPHPRELLILKGEIQQHEASARKIGNLIDRDLERLSGWQNEWMELIEELAQWQEQHSQGQLPAITAESLGELEQELDTGNKAVKVRIRAGLEQRGMVREINTDLFKLAYGLDALLKADLFSAPRQTTTPLFSADFWQQFDSRLWHETLSSVYGFVQLQAHHLGESYLWVILVLLATAALAILLQRISHKLSAYPELAVFREKAFASASFLTILCSWYVSILLYSIRPQLYGLIVFILMLASARLVRFFFDSTLPRLFLERSILFLALTTMLQMVNPPTLITRVFIFCAVISGMGYSYFLAYKIHDAGSKLRTMSIPLFVGTVLLGVLLLIINGSDELAVQAFILLITTYIYAVCAWILYRLLCCLLDIATLLLPLDIIRENALSIANYFKPVLVIVSTLIFLTFTLPKWYVFPSESEALAAILSSEWMIGSVTFSPGLVVEIALILYVAILSTKAIKGMLRQTILPTYGIEAGVQFSIIRLVNYFASIVVFIILLSILGIELTKLTIFGSALGIGVGFGLQAVVNNFVSGLILLFERPIKIGDTVQINSDIGVVQNVGLRSTVIKTFGNAEIVVPNSDLVTGQVINWSLSEKHIRLDIPVGVSYDSDVDQVLEILQECGYDHPLVMSQPPPKPLFLGFGDNSLNFELRVWLNSYIDKFDVLSELNREIEYEFSQHNIKIPYPQRDLHLKTNDIDSINMSLKPSDT